MVEQTDLDRETALWENAYWHQENLLRGKSPRTLQCIHCEEEIPPGYQRRHLVDHGWLTDHQPLALFYLPPSTSD